MTTGAPAPPVRSRTRAMTSSGGPDTTTSAPMSFSAPSRVLSARPTTMISAGAGQAPDHDRGLAQRAGAEHDQRLAGFELPRSTTQLVASESRSSMHSSAADRSSETFARRDIGCSTMYSAAPPHRCGGWVKSNQSPYPARFRHRSNSPTRQVAQR